MTEQEMKARINQLRDLLQDTIQSLNYDLETGSHHMNNAAAEAFAKRYPAFSKDLEKLGAAINQLHDEVCDEE